MDDLFRAFDDRAKIILNEIDSRKSDLVVGVIESTDRVQHMFWRFLDPDAPDVQPPREPPSTATPIERVYRRCDELVGRGARPGRARHARHGALGPRLPLVPAGRQPQLRSWSRRASWRARAEQGLEQKRDEAFLGGQFWQNVDWSRSARVLARPRADLLQPERAARRRASSSRATTTSGWQPI